MHAGAGPAVLARRVQSRSSMPNGSCSKVSRSTALRNYWPLHLLLSSSLAKMDRRRDRSRYDHNACRSAKRWEVPSRSLRRPTNTVVLSHCRPNICESAPLLAERFYAACKPNLNKSTGLAEREGCAASGADVSRLSNSNNAKHTARR